MARISSIVYKPKDQPHAPDSYLRVPLTSAQLIANYGIEGDRKGGHPQRQLNIMSLEHVQQLAREGFQAAPGQLGEQIIVEGLIVEALQAGSRLQIGAACVEIVKPRTGCDRFEHIHGKARTLAAGRMGIIARVISGGAIHVGDTVALLQSIER
ncbi:MAG: MOSC domain-containing protein [Chloroflexi bacterium]|nr:MOSC domain-containing protein [Chloroflexota bacterium]